MKTISLGPRRWHEATVVGERKFSATLGYFATRCGFYVLAIAESHRGVKDREVLSIAVAQERWIVTFDRDYGELIFSQSFPTPPALIYLRLHSYRPELPGRLLVDLLREPSNLAGQFVVIQDENLRKRPLPLR